MIKIQRNKPSYRINQLKIAFYLVIFVGVSLLLLAINATVSRQSTTAERQLRIVPTVYDIVYDGEQRFRDTFYEPAQKERLVNHVDCRAIFEGDNSEIRKAVKFDEKVRSRSGLTVEKLTSRLEDCHAFLNSRGYPRLALSNEEEEFPLAFTIMMQSEVLEVERLLRALYMPQNFYCIHVDGKEPLETHRLMRKFAKCFHNVIVVNPVIVTYTGVSQLTEELLCIRELLRVSPRWKYYLNVAAQEFPLKTNLEFVKILKIYNGSNEIEQFKSDTIKRRTKFKHYNVINATKNKQVLVRSEHLKESPPQGIEIWKSSRYGAFNRKFLEFVMTSFIAKDYFIWLSDSVYPDEAWWGTLNSNGHIGYHSPSTEIKRVERFIARAVIWAGEGYPCYGRFVRAVCVLGLGDLQTLRTYFGPRFFANKFYRNFEPSALDCLEELHANRTVRPQPVNEEFYEMHVKLKTFQMPLV